FHDSAPSAIYTLSLHDALPISEVEAQRQVRAAMTSCDAPSVPAGLLASLHSIPNTTELSTVPDNLAVDESGRLVAVQRPEQAAADRKSTRLNSSHVKISYAVFC